MKTTLFKRKEQTKSDGKTQHKPLLLWPGIVIVTLQWFVRYCLPILFPGDKALMLGVFGGVIGGLAIIIWWIFFSRAALFDRWFAILLMILALAATSKIIDKSIATTMMGMMFPVYSMLLMSLAFVVWAVVSRSLPYKLRRTTMIATILIASGFWAILRTNGMDGEVHQYFAWRWSKTSEERLLSKSNDKLSSIPLNSTEKIAEAEWPGFRGRNRDGIIKGVKIKTNWHQTPPVEMWRKPVGPGCSSFAVMGKLLYTQEQRGKFEMVTCYKLDTGEPVWMHGDSARFWDSHAGAGPRSTPTISNGRIYTLGATGILNVLDAQNGAVVWSRNAASDTGVKVLTWGFTGSPLVVGDVVIISLSGKLAAYNTANGNPLWSSTDGGNSYSSPHLVTIDGVVQVLMMSKSGALSVEPASGKQLWNYAWPIMDRILQPAVISGGDLLFDGESNGIRRVKVSHNQSGWAVKEGWTSDEMKLNFNDISIHKEYAYGFDGPSLACIDIATGKRMWKGSPYRGWLLLLADQDLLIVLTEKGDLSLVDAKPDKFNELARIPAIKGRTWNHPALAGDVLLVRNAEEMAAFRLPNAGS